VLLPSYYYNLIFRISHLPSTKNPTVLVPPIRCLTAEAQLKSNQDASSIQDPLIDQRIERAGGHTGIFTTYTWGLRYQPDISELALICE